MRTILKIALTAALATVALTTTMSAASANRLSIDDQDFDIRWARLTFTGAGGSTNISCEVTLLGSFHSATIVKTRGLLTGFIDHVGVNTPNCTGGRITPLTGKPAVARSLRRLYRNATQNSRGETRYSRGQIVLELTGTTCTITTTEANPAFGTAGVSATGQITGLVTGGPIPLSGGFLCMLASPASFSGTGVVEDLAGNLLFIRLI